MIEEDQVEVDIDLSEIASSFLQNEKTAAGAPLLQNVNVTQNFLSTLMCDWYNPKKEFYNLQNVLDRTSLLRLLQVADEKTYATVCLRIVYQYFHEVQLDINDCKLIGPCEITDVLRMTNQSFKIDLLKLAVSHWTVEDRTQNYGEVKNQILKLQDLEIIERSFFIMAFMLHENQVNRFEFELIKALKSGEEKFGDYKEFLIVPDLQLLLMIMKRKKLFKTIDFTLAQCPYMKYNSTIIDILKKSQEHQIFIVESFDDQGLANKMENLKFVRMTLENYDKLMPTHSEIFKTLMFGWKITNGEYEENLLEKILMQSENEDLIDLIWSTFKLWQKGFILNMKNPIGKRLIDYVDTYDQKNFSTFLIPKYSHEPTFSKRKYFMMLLNRQFYEVQGRTLYDFYIDSELQGEQVNYMIIFYLLEEKGFFKDVDADESIPFAKLKNLAISGGKSFLNDDSFVHSRLYKLDLLLCNIIAYSNWKVSDKNYQNIKMELVRVGLVYKMLFMIVENEDESNFISRIDEFKDEISNFYSERYKSLLKNSNYTSNFFFIFLIAAMKRNKRKIIDTIFQNENFNNLSFKFPENIDTGSIYNYVVLRMLQSGHNLGEKRIPPCWFTPKVMEDFLDSQITYHGHELIEVDCGFMLHQHTKRQEVQSAEDVDNTLIFYEDIGTLSFLLENENVKSSITHPVVSTYIDLKSMKFRRIFQWNLVLFFSLFVVPFTGLFVDHFMMNKLKSEESSHESSMWENFWLTFCVFGLFIVITREFFQFRVFEKGNFRRYIRKVTNWIEIIMILVAAFTLVLFLVNSKEHVAVLSAVLFLFMTTELICLIPLSSSQHYTMIIKNVVTSFPKFFGFFGLMLVPFSFCFCIIFRNKSEGEFFENFQNFWTSLFKLVLMLAGEYTIEIVKLDVFEMIFVSFFVMTTFWLFALIIGFSVNDIKELRDNAREKILEENAKKILQLGKFFYRIYKTYGLGSGKIEDLDPLRKFSAKFCKWLLTKHIFIQKIHKVYVDINTRELSLRFFDRNEKLFSDSSKNFMNEHDFELIREIINARYDARDKEKQD